VSGGARFVEALPNTLPAAHPGDVIGGVLRRFFVDWRLLVGGSILGPVDGMHLRRELRVTHVLSVERDRDDEHGGFAASCRGRAVLPRLDKLRVDLAPALHACLDFARWTLAETDAVLYVHDRLGEGDACAVSYAVLRACCDVSPGHAQARIYEASGRRWNPPAGTVSALEAALDEWRPFGATAQARRRA
jgi:hypothetical protein